jgi:hypothetical protein
MVLLLVVSLSRFFALCFIYSVTKTRSAYTGNEGCWLLCNLPVKIRMPSYCSYIWWGPPTPAQWNLTIFFAVYFCQEFMGLFLTLAARSAFMFVTRCFCFCFKCLWSYQAHLTNLLVDWPCRINVIDKGRVSDRGGHGQNLGVKKNYPSNTCFRLPLYHLFLGILNILSQKLAKYTEKNFLH